MSHDPIIDEVRATRESIAQEYDNDLESPECCRCLVRRWPRAMSARCG